ncbi:MAG: hypothetical protein O2894_05800 [Planctomycetota bacterium]|nr:hypothetical protein [Planctomycetota bacterium]
MAAKKREYTTYQRKVIQRFYDNRDAIEAQRLQELVTEIFLAGGAKKAERLWERAAGLLERVEGLDAEVAAAVVANRDVEALAKIAGSQSG